MRQASEFTPYFRWVFDRLGLKDWQVIVEDDPPENDAYAFVECVYGRKLALVRLSRNYLKGTEEQQRHGAAHEALHAHFTHADQAVRELAGMEHYGLYKLPMEYGVDGVAVAIAPFLPLPSEILEDKASEPVNPDCLTSRHRP